MKSLKIILLMICANLCWGAFAQNEVPNPFYELIGDSIQAEIEYYRTMANNYANGSNGYTKDAAKAQKYGLKVIDICTSLYEDRTSDDITRSNSIWCIYHILMDDNIGLKDEIKAIEWLTKAADAGNQRAIMELISYYSNSDIDKVNELMEFVVFPAPQDGKLPPIVVGLEDEEDLTEQLLSIYFHDSSSSEDKQLQKKIMADLHYKYDESDDQPLKRLCATNLYNFYLCGLPAIEPNEYLGIYWLEKAAELDSEEAIIYLAKYYRDKDEALYKSWLKKLADMQDGAGTISK